MLLSLLSTLFNFRSRANTPETKAGQRMTIRALLIKRKADCQIVLQNRQVSRYDGLIVRCEGQQNGGPPRVVP